MLTVIPGAPALADLMFTSDPPTEAVVGQPYAYRMTAENVTEDRDGRKQRLRFIARALPSWLEFDGNDTIFGTPGADDIGAHVVKLRARVRGDHVDQEFSISVGPGSSRPPPDDAGHADLAASIRVAPNPVSVDGDVTWRASALNVGGTDVANFVLETVFSGDAPVTIDAVDDESCSIEPRAEHTAVVCRWSPLTSGRSRSARVSGRAAGAGEVLAIAHVSIVDSIPVDGNSANDDARVTLRVPQDGSADGGTDSGSGSPVLTLNGPSTMTITVGETYDDAGATAIDDVDGDLTSDIVVDNPVDPNVIGRYSVTYDVIDSAGNASTATRVVEVLPRDPAGGGGGGAGGGLVLLVAVAMLARRTGVVVLRPPGRAEAAGRR